MRNQADSQRTTREIRWVSGARLIPPWYCELLFLQLWSYTESIASYMFSWAGANAQSCSSSENPRVHDFPSSIFLFRISAEREDEIYVNKTTTSSDSPNICIVPPSGLSKASMF